MNKKEEKVSERAKHFKEARANRLYEIAEDYTELIANLLKNQGQVRVCDIAREMGISHVSVLRTLERLERDGYLVKGTSRCIELTEKGREMALFSEKKHLLLTEFLLKLGIPKDVVATDVEGIEHHISATTLKFIEAHVKTLGHA